MRCMLQLDPKATKALFLDQVAQHAVLSCSLAGSISLHRHCFSSLLHSSLDDHVALMWQSCSVAQGPWR